MKTYRELTEAMRQTDDAWTAAYRAVCPPRTWPGDFRYTDAAKGAAGSPLRAAYDAFRAACDEWSSDRNKAA